MCGLRHFLNHLSHFLEVQNDDVFDVFFTRIDPQRRVIQPLLLLRTHKETIVLARPSKDRSSLVT
jgi:hypothetical protein